LVAVKPAAHSPPKARNRRATAEEDYELESSCLRCLLSLLSSPIARQLKQFGVEVTAHVSPNPDYSVDLLGLRLL
jgi:hypothetical protein